jgi:hypothetical protein
VLLYSYDRQCIRELTCALALSVTYTYIGRGGDGDSAYIRRQVINNGRRLFWR